jgi:hypothetical protein
MSALWVLLGLVGAVVLAHLAKPLVEQHWLTAAQFFRVVNPARTGPLRLRLGNPFRAPAFYLRLPLVLLLLAAAYSARETVALEGGPRTAGVWLLVDSSASMGVAQDGTPRVMLAQQEAERILAEARRAAEATEGLSFCWRLSLFDLERRDLVTASRQPDEVRRQLAALEPRPLGTDLSIARRLLEEPLDPQADCPITHLVVISDLPAPDWIAARPDLVTIWRDVGQPVVQRGFVSLRSLVNPLTGDVREIGVEIRAFGQPPASSTLTVMGPDGLVAQLPARWESDGRWYEPLRPTTPGQYTLSLDPPDAYQLDDRVAVDVPASGTVRVDWQLPDRRWPDLLRWQPAGTMPNLRVVSASALNDELVDGVPTLFVGDGYELPPPAAAPVPISDFADGTALLDDLNFDVVETLVPRGQTGLPPGFRPILRQGQDRVWLAQRQRPPAVYIAGLPPVAADDQGRLTLTVFFNAVRQLLRDRPISPLYELTSPANPIPEGTRLALHEDEGNTVHAPRDHGTLSDLRQIGRETHEPLWPLLLALAAVLFAVERMLATFGGRAWR